MTVIVPHYSTQAVVIRRLDEGSDKLLGGGIKNVEIVDQQKTWDGSVMSFSFTGKLGYISVPLAGTFSVDEKNVTLDCELPPLVKNFLGEEKFRNLMEENVRGIVAAGE